jgi:hypothetical protein
MQDKIVLPRTRHRTRRTEFFAAFLRNSDERSVPQTYGMLVAKFQMPVLFHVWPRNTHFHLPHQRFWTTFSGSRTPRIQSKVSCIGGSSTSVFGSGHRKFRMLCLSLLPAAFSRKERPGTERCFIERFVLPRTPRIKIRRSLAGVKNIDTMMTSVDAHPAGSATGSTVRCSGLVRTASRLLLTSSTNQHLSED